MMIPFNKPYMTGKELFYIAEAHFNCMLSGDGPFTRKAQSWLEKEIGSKKVLLTHSCTAALEMAAILLDIRPGDEIIMPSFTFVSTANAFVLRGGIPVFVDVRADTLNIDETKIEDLITARTKAIVVVHYAGVACEMDAIMNISRRHKIPVIEDAAQALMSHYKSRPLGSIGDIGCVSFHETKNIISGEGGALLLNDEKYIEKAEIIREKGTNRSQFFRGQIDKYTWCEVGSSFLPGELTAAFLCAQLEEAHEITNRRLAIWSRYHEFLAPLEEAGILRRPIVPVECDHNGHMYYLLFANLAMRTAFIEGLKLAGISSVFHYTPLHSSSAGLRYGKIKGNLPVTDNTANCLVRLPMWVGLEEYVDQVISSIIAVLKDIKKVS